MKRESFIFYKSFYESIKELDAEHQVEIYNAIFDFEFYDIEPELTGISKSIFTLIIPQLKANDKRFENGKKGGRPKTKQEPKQNQTETKTKPNNNQTITKVKPNDNVNVNDNDNDNDKYNIYDYIEQNFGRTLNSIEYEFVSGWEDNELTRYAIKQSVLNGKYNIKYISRILESYKLKNIKTVQEAQQDEAVFKNKQTPPEETPSWFNKKIEKQKINKEDEDELKNMLSEFN